MTVETDIAAVADAGDNTPADVRTALTSVLAAIPDDIQYLGRRLSGETAHADDQFFGGTLGGTAVTPSGTVVWSHTNQLLAAVANGQSSSDAACRLYALTPTVSPVTIETAFRPLFYDATFPMAGLIFTDGTTDSANAVSFSHYQNGAAQIVEMRSGTVTNLATGAGAISTLIPSEWGGGVGRIYMRLIWAGANSFKLQLSANGASWTDLSYGAKALTLTPTHFGVIASAYGGAQDMTVAYDYLRVAEADLSA